MRSSQKNSDLSTQFICVTGADGSGKSTVCRELIDRWNRRYGEGFAAHVSVWDFLSEPNEYGSKRAIYDSLAALEPVERMRTWLNLYRRSLEFRRKSGPRVLLLDGYWYRFAATELAYGVPIDQILNEVKNFPRPNRIFLLEVDRTTTVKRKLGAFHPYERGVMRGGLGESDGPHEEFLRFQSKITSEWDRVEAQAAPWVHVPAEIPLLKLADALDDASRDVLEKEDRDFNPRLVHSVIYNPNADEGMARLKWQRLLSTAFAEHSGLSSAAIFDGRAISDRTCFGAKLNEWITGEILAGARNFVAAGGDGTVHLVLNALLDVQKRLGLAPETLRLGAIGMGATNSFHKPFGAVERMLVEGISCRLDFSRPISHDIGIITDDQGSEKHFVMNTNVGMIAEGCWSLRRNGFILKKLKRNWLNGAAFITGLRTCLGYRNIPLRLSVNGEAKRPCRLTQLSVVKNPQVLANLRHETPGQPNEGRLGVYLSAGMGRLERFRLLSAISRGVFSGNPISQSAVDEAAAAQTVELEADEPFSIEADGELVRTRKAVLKIQPHGFLVCP